MSDVSVYVPWILGGLGAAFLILIVVIIVKCVSGMKAFKEAEQQPVISERAVVIEKIHTVHKATKIDVHSIERVSEESISVVLKIKNERKTFEIGQILYDNLQENMSGIAQIKAGRLVGFITDDGEAISDGIN